MNARPLVFLATFLFTISCHHEETKNKTVLSKVTINAFGEIDEYIYRSDGTLLKRDIYIGGGLLSHLDYTYDQRRIALIKEYLRDTLYSTTSFIYDANNNLTEVHAVPSNNFGEEQILKVTSANNQIQKIDDLAEGISTSFEYDTRNNATKITVTNTNTGIITYTFERTYDDHVNPLYGLGDPMDDYDYDLPAGVPIFPNNCTSEIARDGDGTIYSSAQIKNTYNKQGFIVNSVTITTHPGTDSSDETITEYAYKNM
jgi:hypothetical protein